ncbi:MAG: hypothetical protein B6I35_11820 [Anaerolineaceae bacterium 4572_32.2]|nr:MAG: hypothetical protein B6I35_11820 [Anaerolineaceae bacterium 4572_32.2]
MIRLVRSAIAITVVGVLALASCSQPKEPPRLIIDESVAGDFETLALETWEQFLAVFQARRDCFGDVNLRATKTLDSRAGYDPERAAVTVRVPATAAMLQGALVHEWAHHVEFQCEDHKALRPAFLAAQGLPLDTAWRPDIPPADIPASMWPDIPSEQYAEATIMLVLGRRQIATGVRLKPEAVRVIGEWAAGD